MLIRFRVGNFLSFDETQTFSLVGGNTRGHEDHRKDLGFISILRCSAVYGGNASGKTNFVKALKTMRNMVIGINPPSDGYFRPKPENRDKESYFEVEVELDGSIYSYGFDYVVSSHTVVDEWLYRLSVDDENEIIFQRAEGTVTHRFSGDDGKRLDVYGEDAESHSDRLFLSMMSSRVRRNDVGLKVFGDILNWFRSGLRFVDNDYGFGPENSLSDADFDGINELISTFGTGINSIGYERRDSVEGILTGRTIDWMKNLLSSGKDAGNEKYIGSGRYRVSMEHDDLVIDEVVYRHNSDRVSFRPEEESSGTRKLYGFLASMFFGPPGTTYILDELDSGFHPDLSYRLVELFLESAPERDSQLVFTTHETMLMTHDLLRRDEIWFIDKDAEGASRMNSLEDFNERNDRRVEKAYREGRYGGKPVFGTAGMRR